LPEEEMAAMLEQRGVEYVVVDEAVDGLKEFTH
jgi:hypothetical protein